MQMNQDTIRITGLNCCATIGAFDHERTIKQTLKIDLTLGWDCQRAANTDELSYTLDYGVLCQALQTYVAGTAFQLIERLAKACIDFIHEQFQVKFIQVTIHKPLAIADAADISCTMSQEFP